ncbi:MAG: hypothetical protein AAF355_14470 [Myxococcota bacterium]
MRYVPRLLLLRALLVLLTLSSFTRSARADAILVAVVESEVPSVDPIAFRDRLTEEVGGLVVSLTDVRALEAQASLALTILASGVYRVHLRTLSGAQTSIGGSVAPQNIGDGAFLVDVCLEIFDEFALLPLADLHLAEVLDPWRRRRWLNSGRWLLHSEVIDPFPNVPPRRRLPQSLSEVLDPWSRVTRRTLPSDLDPWASRPDTAFRLGAPR